jgi:HPt (histidine-containing phosphotransfer) domain-containing protein
MGLRAFMLGAQGLREGVEQYAAGSEAEALGKAQSAYRESAPTLIQQIRAEASPEKQAQLAGQYQNLVSRAKMSKEDPYSDVIAKMLFKPVGASGAPLTKEQLTALNPDASVEAVDAASQVQDPKIQAKVIADWNVNNRSNKNRAITNEKMSVAQGTKGFDVINKTSDAFRTEGYGVKSIKDIADMKGQLPDNILGNFVIRNVGNEKGPLSDSDRAAIMGVFQFEGQWDEFASRFKGGSYSKMNPEVRTQLESIIKKAAANFDARKAEAYAQDLSGLYSSQSRLKDSDGNPTGILKDTLERLKKEKVPVEFDPKSKSFVVNKSQKKMSGGRGQLVAEAGKIKDPALKTRYMQYLNKNEAKEFSDEEVNHILKQMQGK